MKDEKYISKKQLMEEFGISRSTFYRILRRFHCAVSRESLSPLEAEDLRSLLLNKRAYVPPPDSEGGTT